MITGNHRVNAKNRRISSTYTKYLRNIRENCTFDHRYHVVADEHVVTSSSYTHRHHGSQTDKQRSYLKKISNSFINFKKEGATKMNRGSCKVRVKGIDNYWQKIVETLNQILESAYLDHKHEYFQKKYIYNVSEFEKFLINVTSAYLTPEKDRAESITKNAADQLVKLPLPEWPKFSGNFR
ncbi:hypothetical protein J437_LFUL014625 [Ladona fulva]|uniref:Uncharacterized protein n=1 Tax=Ladona fulva TaxID=123851 RepID=A0A8K0P9Z6_LADFU|nr:hypothetical protein J437_LFUL014625 [Ladona fulva]